MPPMQVWIDGAFVDLEEARVSAFDAGFQHAVGLFETMAAREGRVSFLRRHLARLRDSAEALRLTRRVEIDPLADAVRLTLERNGLDEARVRLTMSGGDLNLLGRGERRAARPTVLIVAQPPTRYPDEFFTQGVAVTIADGRLNPFDPLAGHKTLSYWSRLGALQQAAGAGAGEAIWFTVSNHLASGSVSNVFLVKDGTLVTPIARGEEAAVAGGEPDAEPAPDGDRKLALPSPVLPGITRGVVLELARERSLPAERKMLDINDLLEADEVFLTNASWGVLPVVRVERATIADGSVGEITVSLRDAWRERATSKSTEA